MLLPYLTGKTIPGYGVTSKPDGNLGPLKLYTNYSSLFLNKIYK